MILDVDQWTVATYDRWELMDDQHIPMAIESSEDETVLTIVT